MSEQSVGGLKTIIRTLHNMENDLQTSPWHALTADKQLAQKHLTLARDHLNNLLNLDEPIDFVPSPPPPMDDPLGE